MPKKEGDIISVRTNARITDPQKKLLDLLSNALFGCRKEVSIDDRVLSEAREQAVSTIISPDYAVLAKNICVISAHAELTRILQDIPFATFKGYASALYYPDSFSRPLGDVDFYVETSNVERVVTKLKEYGWEKMNDHHVRHISFQKGRVIAELHTEIKGIPNGADGIKVESPKAEESVRELLSDLIETAKTVETQHGRIVIPDEFHHGLIMLLHIASHMINDGGIGLRHLCDWAVYVNQVSVVKYRSQLKKAGLWTFACQLTEVSSKYIGLPDQPWTEKFSEQFLSDLIFEILSAGNFGHREAGRVGLAKMRRSSFVEMTKTHYPAARNPLLLPLFMIVYVVRYGVLVLKRRRRFIKPRTVLGQRKRDKLFKQFKLFE